MSNRQKVKNVFSDLSTLSAGLYQEHGINTRAFDRGESAALCDELNLDLIRFIGTPQSTRPCRLNFMVRFGDQMSYLDHAAWSFDYYDSDNFYNNVLNVVDSGKFRITRNDIYKAVFRQIRSKNYLNKGFRLERKYLHGEGNYATFYLESTMLYRFEWVFNRWLNITCGDYLCDTMIVHNYDDHVPNFYSTASGRWIKMDKNGNPHDGLIKHIEEICDLKQRRWYHVFK